MKFLYLWAVIKLLWCLIFFRKIFFSVSFPWLNRLYNRIQNSYRISTRWPQFRISSYTNDFFLYFYSITVYVKCGIADSNCVWNDLNFMEYTLISPRKSICSAANWQWWRVGIMIVICVRILYSDLKKTLLELKWGKVVTKVN